jgi:dipeptidyl aminopeptidase/acylaminoacyl peptidase
LEASRTVTVRPVLDCRALRAVALLAVVASGCSTGRSPSTPPIGASPTTVTPSCSGTGVSSVGGSVPQTELSGRLAFARASKPGGQLDLFVAKADGTDARVIAGSPENDEFSPTWAPDGYHIAFRVNPSGEFDPDIWGADDTGRDARDLTATPDASEWSPAWSPDGSRIAFCASANDQEGATSSR